MASAASRPFSVSVVSRFTTSSAVRRAKPWRPALAEFAAAPICLLLASPIRPPARKTVRILFLLPGAPAAAWREPRRPDRVQRARSIGRSGRVMAQVMPEQLRPALRGRGTGLAAEHRYIQGGQEHQHQERPDQQAAHDGERHGPQNTVGAMGIRPSTVENAVSVSGRSRELAALITASHTFLPSSRRSRSAPPGSPRSSRPCRAGTEYRGWRRSRAAD